MRFGVFGLGSGALASPSAATIARLAEEAEWDSIWLADHAVLPNVRPEYLKVPADWAIADPMLMLAYIAASTSKIRLCTGIANIAQRNPVYFAKEIATLDRLAPGRVTIGVGIGNLAAEMAAVGLDPAGRGARAEDHLHGMHALWRGDPAYRGEYVAFDDVSAFPQPDPSKGPPIVWGGESEAALRRAVRLGSGWFGWKIQPAAVREFRQRLTRLADEEGCSAAGFQIYISPAETLTKELIHEYADAGVDELIVSVESRNLEGSQRKLEELTALIATARHTAEHLDD